MARLIIKNATSEPVQAIVLKPGVNRFGRSPSNDHMLPDISISEAHCEILLDGDFVFVRDLGSMNGTFVDDKRVVESALYCGQTIRIGPVEFVLDAPPIVLAVPEIPKPPPETVPAPVLLTDGYPSCPNHPARHAVWECTACQRVYCDTCIRKPRRVGGAQLKLCAACSHPCKLTPWSQMISGKKKGILGRLVSKVKDGLAKRTTRPL